MKALEQQLIHINDISLEIVNELGKEEPSMESINRQMDLRERYIDELDALSKKQETARVSETDRNLIKNLFDNFNDLSDSIGTLLHEALYNHQEKLKNAARHRKAEDRYQVLKKPDISYF